MIQKINTSITPSEEVNKINEIIDKINQDSSTISGWAMPSSRYIDLTLGASGATYTAPANGYFQFAWLGEHSTCQMYNNSSNDFWTTNAGETQSCWIPVKNNDVMQMYYTFGTVASLRWFRFYYAEGDKNV